jgi:hypothetical protein
MLTVPKSTVRAQIIGACLFAVLLWSQSTAWANQTSECRPPASLAKQITESFAGYTIVTIDTLRTSDRARFRADHPRSCPGLVKLDFYGTGVPTYGLALVRRQGKQVLLKLVVASRAQKAATWDLRQLDQADNLVAAPAIWAEPPGEYKDVHEKNTIKAQHPVLLAAQYEAWAIAFAWSKDEIKKVWITD